MRRFLPCILVASILIPSLAGCPQFDQVLPVLNFPGDLPVKRWNTVYNGLLPLVIFYPDTDPPQQDLPLVVFNPGWNQMPASYLIYGKQLAQWEYVAAVMRAYPSLGTSGIIGLDVGINTNDEQVRQNSDVIDWCTEQNLRPESPLFGMVDTTRVGVTGHSLGARVTVAAAEADPRFSAVVNLDSIFETDTWPLGDDQDQTDAAILLDRLRHRQHVRRPVRRRPLYDRAHAPTLEVVIHGADHIDFMELFPMLEAVASIFCGVGTADPHVVQAIATRYMIAWFNVYLKGLDEYEEYFNGTLSQQDEADGLVTIRANL